MLLATALILSFTLSVVPMTVSVKGAEDLSLDLWYMPVERPYFPDAKSVAEIMEADLEAIGVDIKLVTYEWGEYLDRTEDGEHDMALLGWSADIGDPDNFLYVLLSGDSAVEGSAMNIAFYDNDAVDEKLLDAQKTFDQDERDTLYKDACYLIHKDAPWVSVAHSENLAGYSKDVTGFVTHPTGPGANVYEGVSVTGSETLVIARGGDAVTLDPAEWTDGQSWKVGRQIYDGLYNMPADSIEPEPALATGYTVSDDGLEWTFTLRDGVKFHDGSAFDADAVVFNFERAANWNNETSPYYTNGWIPPEAGYYDYIYGGLDLEVEALSATSVKFTMAIPYAPFLASLAMGVFAFVSPTYVKAHTGTQSADRIGLNPVGTGPYMMKEWVVDQTITLEANPDYWGTAPKTNEIVFKVITEGASRMNELTAGDVHIVDNLAATDVATVEGDADLSLSSQAGMNVGYLAMNALKAPFNDETKVDDPDYEGEETTKATLVRRAFNHAINKSKIIEQVFQGRAVQAKNPLPPNFWGYNDTITDFTYDPDKARELLELAGFNTTGGGSAGPDLFVTMIGVLGSFSALMVVNKKRRR